MKEGERIYRNVEPSDLPAVQAGKLKAVSQSGMDYYPVKLISTRVTPDKHPLWLIDYGSYDAYAVGYRSILVDITPEKRYAIWNKKRDRFMLSGNETPHFNTEQQAKDYIAQKFVCSDRTAIVIVSFDYPGEY